MRLVKRGKIVENRYVRILDEAPVPEDMPVLVPAARFLADTADFARREAPTGIIWPNNQKVSELAPYLDQLTLVALVFPSFRDGRAYSQARQLRERYDFHGELRATGQILRDQFVFLMRAGFDGFDVVKPADAAAFEEAAQRYSVFFQPTGDGRLTVARVRTRTTRRPADARSERVPA